MKLWPLSVIVLCAVLTALIYCQRLYFNIYSSSLPTGIYRRLDTVPEKGMYGASCLSPALARLGLKNGYLLKGNCRSGIQPVMKEIHASKGDVVEVFDNELFINGVRLHGFDFLSSDSKGRAVHRFLEGRIQLAEGEFWLMSDYKKNSWDSRYWGPVSVEFALEPILIIKR